MRSAGVVEMPAQGLGACDRIARTGYPLPSMVEMPAQGLRACDNALPCPFLPETAWRCLRKGLVLATPTTPSATSRIAGWRCLRKGLVLATTHSCFARARRIRVEMPAQGLRACDGRSLEMPAQGLRACDRVVDMRSSCFFRRWRCLRRGFVLAIDGLCYSIHSSPRGGGDACAGASCLRRAGVVGVDVGRER